MTQKYDCGTEGHFSWLWLTIWAEICSSKNLWKPIIVQPKLKAKEANFSMETCLVFFVVVLSLPINHGLH